MWFSCLQGGEIFLTLQIMRVKLQELIEALELEGVKIEGGQGRSEEGLSVGERSGGNWEFRCFQNEYFLGE